MSCFNESLDSENCFLSPERAGIYDAIAGIRMISSLLGVFGATSIIFSVIWKRRLLHSEVHPIFMLSLSDCLLALLWITGSSIWLSSARDKAAWCYSLTLITAVMECIAVNLTVVYSVFAYAKIRKTDLNSVLAHSIRNEISWKVTVPVYSVAWSFPLFFIILVFSVTIGSNTDLLSKVNECSCWCIPSLINIFPAVKDINKNTMIMRHLQARLMVGLGIVIILHYLLAFILLMVLYKKILNKIKKIRQEHEQLVFGRKAIDNSNHSKYGSAEKNRIEVGHSEAKKRVVLFISVFICSGLFNMVLAILLVVFLSSYLAHDHDEATNHSHDSLFDIFKGFIYAQSLTLPLQGFMNAIVYGWTRDDFVHTIAINRTEEMNSDVPNNFSNATELIYNESSRDNDFEETINANSDRDSD
ncbi:PREDICTED: transmembrane protein 116-like [Amphimedon queenslandica]|uniref:G-protein coupled receptors family 1 profile domain-containing protein n=1 Tax=Amphimedon queenslandica TaxID=400682 RepID=A0A1X7T773_AMPQE|nr:PREDICTED: transmembrane protein 116-like [Amphimedon queenslandica]|eukprot:XP_019861081.1 PREDICTED: transmembrane protein 116-like [Amphimedon queenslandica]